MECHLGVTNLGGLWLDSHFHKLTEDLVFVVVDVSLTLGRSNPIHCRLLPPLCGIILAFKLKDACSAKVKEKTIRAFF